MSTCNFSIPFSGEPESIVEKARKQVQKYGIFQGDSRSGSFEIKLLGTISGSYLIAAGQMQIAIEEKPIFLSCNKIEQFMNEHIG